MNKTTFMDRTKTKLPANYQRRAKLQLGGLTDDGAPKISKPRILMYSHDTMGIGHMRRNLLIATQLQKAIPDSNVLIVAGAKEATTFATKAGIDCLTLPSYSKQSDGTYQSRSLAISVQEIREIRQRTILAAAQGFKPNVFIVDKVPAGLGGELLPTLNHLADSQCKLILGLREILDSPEHVERDWKSNRTIETIREYFDEVWVYGDPDVYDTVNEYSIPKDIQSKVSYTGYLNASSRLSNTKQRPAELRTPYHLCTVGGGQDGFELAHAFAKAISLTGTNAVLLAGPYMPLDSFRQLVSLAKKIPSLKVVRFHDEGDLLVKFADRVVAMGGYNTVSAILSHQKNAMIVPRTSPRVEQWIRAKRLAKLGLITMQDPRNISADTIADYLLGDGTVLETVRTTINLDGLENLTRQLKRSFVKRVAERSSQ